MSLDWNELVDNNPVLSNLPDSLKAAASFRPFSESETLFRRWTHPRVMLYVLDGEVRLVRHTAGGNQVVLQRSQKGFVAEASMDSKAYHCDLVGAVAGHLLAFPISKFRAALDGEAAFRRAWMTTLAVEVRRLRAQNERLHLKKAADRVIHYIESEGLNGIVALSRSRKAWAVELGLSHEALYRCLAGMEAEQLIAINGDSIQLRGNQDERLSSAQSRVCAGVCTPVNPDPLDQIRSLYTELALRPEKEFGWSKGKGNARQLGYADDWLARLPDVVWESAAAVGNPFAVGPIHPGETVVDLGCGAGADACVAALLVGDKGKVYGIDATPAMVSKATNNAKVAGLSQIELREADIIHLGLPSAVADVVISNGAINLTLDKPKVFAEVFRILRRNGRFQFADMIREHEAPAACSGESSWADCVSGTMGVDEIKTLLHEAGFVDIQLVELTGYKTSASTVGATFKARKA